LRKSVFFLLPILFLALASTVLADSFTVTSTVAPSQAFTLTFSLPSTIGSLTEFATVIVSSPSPSLNLTLPGAEIDFFSSAAGGLFDVIGTSGSTAYSFAFFGAQSYTGTGPFTLLTGTFPLSAVDGFGDFAFVPVNSNVNPTVLPLVGGSVTVASGGGPTPTPEPGTFALLGAGLVVVGALGRKLRLA
jgi:hypothetical protein